MFFLAAEASSAALDFGIFWLQWQDMCQATARTEADIILHPGAEKPTERDFVRTPMFAAAQGQGVSMTGFLGVVSTKVFYLIW